MATGLQVDCTVGMVCMAGELDLATRDEAFDACSTCLGVDVVLDLSSLTFMDGSGYRAILAARRVLEGQGRTLTLRGAVGEPARLLDLLVGGDGAQPVATAMAAAGSARC